MYRFGLTRPSIIVEGVASYLGGKGDINLNYETFTGQVTGPEALDTGYLVSERQPRGISSTVSSRGHSSDTASRSFSTTRLRRTLT